ncbi:MAG: BolA family protein [Candidatus Binatia bacterium]
MSVTSADIESILRRDLAAVHVEAADESARHEGHAGAASGGGHFRVLVVAAAFEGKNPLERHRLVYETLGDLIPGEIHALALRTLTPDEHREVSPRSAS